MKKALLSILALALLVLTVFAVVPEKMTYQAIIRDSGGQLITDKQISMRVSILKGSATGSSVYVETHTPTTNNNGLVAIAIGDGTVITGAFSSVDWSNDDYFIKTEVDVNGGTAYTISGTSQLMSVPYALHSKSAENLSAFSITPSIASRGQRLSVSFSGGNNLEFAAATSTCPVRVANAHLRIQQGTTTTLTPLDVQFINNKRFDVLFDIPSFVPAGNYDVIIAPNSNCPAIVWPGVFKIH